LLFSLVRNSDLVELNAQEGARLYGLQARILALFRQVAKMVDFAEEEGAVKTAEEVGGVYWELSKWVDEIAEEVSRFEPPAPAFSGSDALRRLTKKWTEKDQELASKVKGKGRAE
jgi:hypothetical protein